MLRWMICPVLAPTGTPGPTNSYRAAVQDVPGTNSSAIIPTQASGPNIGKPKYNFALCWVATSNVSTIAAVSNAFVFPDYNLDGRMDGMDPASRQGLVQSVQAYNFDGNGFHLDASNGDSDSYRSLLESLSHQIDPGVNINAINVAEVAG